MHANRDISGAGVERIHLDRAYQSFDGITHGGYVAGLLLRRLGGAAEVTLRRPPPSGRAVWLRQVDADTLELADAATLIARATRAEVDVEPPPAVDFDHALAASASYLGLVANPAPRCFVCGPGRSPPEGLRVFSGPLAPGLVAAPWVPAPHLAGADGVVAPEFVAAVLDCPGAWAIAALGERYHVRLLLGGYRLRLEAPVRAGVPHVAVGRAEDGEGRTRFTVTAIRDDRGRVCARAQSTWFLPK